MCVNFLLIFCFHLLREECDEFKLSAPRYALKLGVNCAANVCLEPITAKIGASRTKETFFAPELALEMPELVTPPSPRIPSTSRRRRLIHPTPMCRSREDVTSDRFLPFIN